MSSGLPIPFGWYAVAYSSDLEPGDVEPIFYFDRHMVMFRTESGQAKVLDAYCPHLGAHLGHGGQVKGEHIACPFHAWELNGDGEVKHIPYAKTMPRRTTEGACIHSYPVQERNQMIWVWYHPRGLAPVFDIVDIPELNDPDWAELDNYEFEFSSCIQETGENAVDIAHFVYVHSAREMPKADVKLDGFYRETEMKTLGPVIDEEGNLDMDQLEESHLVTRSWGPGMTCQAFSRAFKTVMMGTVIPVTADKVKLRFSFTKPNDISEIFNIYTDGLITEIVNQVTNDIPIWEHKKYQESPILCDGDGPIAKYRKWFGQFYDDGSDETPVRMVQ